MLNQQNGGLASGKIEKYGETSAAAWHHGGSKRAWRGGRNVKA